MNRTILKLCAPLPLAAVLFLYAGLIVSAGILWLTTGWLLGYYLGFMAAALRAGEPKVEQEEGDVHSDKA